jgi:hypothetical protein
MDLDVVDWNSGVTNQDSKQTYDSSSKELPIPLGSEAPDKHSEMTLSVTS